MPGRTYWRPPAAAPWPRGCGRTWAWTRPWALQRSGNGGANNDPSFSQSHMAVRPPPQCFRCGKPGHWAIHCPSGNRCYRCRSWGHWAKDCPLPKDRCFRCGRFGHWAEYCDAAPNQPGIYALLFSNGHVYVGRSNDITRRIRQHTERDPTAPQCTAQWGDVPGQPFKKNIARIRYRLYLCLQRETRRIWRDGSETIPGPVI